MRKLSHLANGAARRGAARRGAARPGASGRWGELFDPNTGEVQARATGGRGGGGRCGGAAADAQAEALLALFAGLGHGGKDFSAVLQMLRARLETLS